MPEPYTPAELEAVLPGMDAGSRTQILEFRVIVNPDQPAPHRWVVHVPVGVSPERVVADFVVPIQIQARTVTTYTTQWQALNHD